MPSTLGIVASAYHFNVLDFSPVAWYDASDTSTITSSGSPAKVSQWNDKSGNGRHLAQGNAANQPTTGANTVNGRNVLTGDGNVNLFRLTTPFRKNVTGSTVYTVRRWTSAPTSNRTIFTVIFETTSTTALNVAAGSVSGKSSIGGRTVTTESFQRLDSSASASTTAAEIQTAWFDYANTDANQYLGTGVDGSTTSWQSATTTSNVDTTVHVMNSFTNANVGLIGYLAEVIYFDVAHSAAVRDQFWRYLASKWGITL
jgi:hypothetical protein